MAAIVPASPAAGPTPPAQPPQAERFGPYTLLEELGRGGRGVVYRARQTAPDREVALKVLSGLRFASERDRERFVVEAGIASRLEHPGIVPVFEVGEVEGQSFYTMARIESGSLMERLGRGPFEPREAVQLLVKLCDAVQYAHAEGIVHRDLKPDNVLFDASGHPRITDFGLAKDFASGRELTQTGEILGTPSYMAPEQISGENPIGPGADVYALGCILYTCLTGQPPFRAATIVSTLRQVLEAVPVPPRLANPAVPRELDAICLRCIEKRPEDRYLSAKHLADDLTAFLEGRPIHADDGRTNAFVRLLLQETRHTDVMARWSHIGMLHAGLVFALFASTGLLFLLGVSPETIFWTLWLPGGLAATAVPMLLRVRRGPLNQVERQLAQVWCIFAIVVAITIFCHVVAARGSLADLVPLVLAEAALTIGCMSVILRGSFYSLAVAYGLCSLGVALTPAWTVAPFGAAAAALHFIIAWRAQHREPERVSSQSAAEVTAVQFETSAQSLTSAR